MSLKGRGLSLGDHGSRDLQIRNLINPVCHATTGRTFIIPGPLAETEIEPSQPWADAPKQTR